jgi:hypothetical protein
MSVRALSASPDLSNYSDKPTIRGIAGAREFFASEGFDVGSHALNEAVYYKKTLPRFKFGRYIHFSKRDLMQWAYSQRGLSRRGS